MERNYDLLKQVLSVPTKTYKEDLMIQFITNWLTENNIPFYVDEMYNIYLAIKNGKERFIAFRLPHHNQDYIVKKNQYKNLLNTMLRYAEEDEDYDRCVLIKKIIENL